MNEISNGEKVLRLYILATYSVFIYTAYIRCIDSDNYFSAVLIFMDDPFT